MAFPGILRRLFANNGAGPLLRADILPQQNVAIDNLFIGAPIYQPTTTLPANCMWPDGSLALFSDWPQFAAKYQAGGFAGMVDNASNNTNLGKFILNSNGTGLYLPRHGGQLCGNWTPGFGTAGAWTRDETRNVTGEFWGGSPGSTTYMGYDYLKTTGAFIAGRATLYGISSDNSTPGNAIAIDISRVANTGPKVKPESIDQPVVIYMGSHA